MSLSARIEPALDRELKNMECFSAMECAAIAENRKEQRYDVFMKVIAKEISQFPGCVQNVSKSGCKINFPDIEDFDFEREYSATLYSQGSMGVCTFDLTLKPVWTAPSKQGAMMGFSILRSPGYRGFIRFVESLAETEETGEASAD